MKKSILISFICAIAFVTVNAQEKKSEPITYEITKAKLLKMKTVFDLLKVVDPSTDYSGYICRSFNLVGNFAGKEHSETSTGGDINEKQKNMISETPVDAKLYIEQLRVLEKGKRQTNLLPTLILTLK